MFQADAIITWQMRLVSFLPLSSVNLKKQRSRESMFDRLKAVECDQIIKNEDER